MKKVLHKGLLLSKSSEDSDVWNVKIEGEGKERPMNEELFGRIVQVGKTPPQTTGKQQKKSSKPRGRPPKNKRGVSINTKRKGNIDVSESICTSSLERLNDEKINSNSKDLSKASRSKTKATVKKNASVGRRKKKGNAVEESSEKVPDSSNQDNSPDATKSDENATETENGGTTRVSTRSSSRKRNHTDIAAPLSFARKKGSKGRHAGRGGKRLRKMKGEEVEKVKFLTGTLYLYRGENPRVAFVRHY